LVQVRDKIDKTLNGFLSVRTRTGCSIACDAWTNVNRKPLINYMMLTPRGSKFMYAVDCSGQKKDALLNGKLICEAIEAAGPSTVVAVIQDSAAVNIAAGDFVLARFPHVGMLRCTAHFTNLALTDLANEFPAVQKAIEKANNIVKCILSRRSQLRSKGAQTSPRRQRRSRARRRAQAAGQSSGRPSTRAHSPSPSSPGPRWCW
jgi:hypothetical protein